MSEKLVGQDSYTMSTDWTVSQENSQILEAEFHSSLFCQNIKIMVTKSEFAIIDVQELCAQIIEIVFKREKILKIQQKLPELQKLLREIDSNEIEEARLLFAALEVKMQLLASDINELLEKIPEGVDFLAEAGGGGFPDIRLGRRGRLSQPGVLPAAHCRGVCRGFQGGGAKGLCGTGKSGRPGRSGFPPDLSAGQKTVTAEPHLIRTGRPWGRSGPCPR